jgi:hypothetical protein
MRPHRLLAIAFVSLLVVGLVLTTVFDHVLAGETTWLWIAYDFSLGAERADLYMPPMVFFTPLRVIGTVLVIVSVIVLVALFGYRVESSGEQ